MKLSDAISEIIVKEKRNIPQQEIAEIIGVSRQYIGQIKECELTTAHKEILEKHFNIDFNKIESNCYVLLDYYPDMEVSCGHGIIPFGATKSQIEVPVSLIKGYSSNKKYIILNAISDSMSPEIKPNDKLIVRLIDAEPIMDNHIYIFCHDERLYCKYLSYNVGQVIVRSANTDYPTRYIEGEKLETFRLCGEVCGSFREY